MKRFIISTLIVLAAGLSTPQGILAQGTTYLSNLGQPSTASSAVASDSWLAEDFTTGTNAAGYILDSIQIMMTSASGAPSGFTLTLHTNANPAGTVLGGSIGSLSGSPDPALAGTYTYTAPASLILSRQHHYFVVLTATTSLADGAYQWSLAGTSSYNPTGGWFSGGSLFQSNNGSSLDTIAGAFPQFAINATPVPEPGVSALLALGGLCFLRIRRKSGKS